MQALDVELGAVPTPGGTRFALWSTAARSASVRIFANAPQPPNAPYALRTEPLVAKSGGIF